MRVYLARRIQGCELGLCVRGGAVILYHNKDNDDAD